MKLVHEGDKLVKALLGAPAQDKNSLYRWSIYAVQHQYDDKNYLFNNLNKVCLQLQDEDITIDYRERFSMEKIKGDNLLLKLFMDRFLVRENADEAAVYVGYCKLARALRQKNEGYSRYTILPTTACNARCVYCFEAGMKYVTMSESILNQTIDFIIKTHNPKKPINFAWFGGEPLMGEKKISRICEAMRDNGIEYKSSMITNGSLITDDVIKKMKEDWNVKRVQITLDGTEEQYNARKNYVFNYDSAYWHVLANIKRVNDNGISLTIRVNVDHENVDSILIMLEDVKNFISNPSLVSFDLTPLYDLQESNGIEIWDKCLQASDKIKEHGFRTSARYSVDTTRVNFCMADSPYTSVVIAPDGKLYTCEHVKEVESIGDIWNGITNKMLLKNLLSVADAPVKCKNCFSLPHCTTFTGCPNSKGDCRYAERKLLERALDKMIRFKANESVSADIDDEQDEEC